MLISEPNASGHFGPYGGRFVPEVLMSPLEELETTFFEARKDPAFQAELADLLRNYAGRPTPLYFAKRLSRNPGRRGHLPEARRPAAHRRAQDQQLPGAGSAGAAHGQEAHYRRDGRGPAWRGDGDGVRAVRLGLHGLHGRGRHAPAAPQRVPHAPAGRQGGRRDQRQPHPEGRDQRSHARLGDECLDDALPAGLGAGLASLSADGARVSSRHRRGGARADSGARRAACRTRSLPAWAEAATRSASSIRSWPMPACGWSAWKRADAANGLGEHAARFSGGSPGVLQGAFSYLLQDADGQVSLTHSVSAGLDYAMVGPEHAFLHDARTRGIHVDDRRGALEAALRLSRTEGIIPALECCACGGRSDSARAGGEGPDVPGERLGTRRQGHRYLPRELSGTGPDLTRINKLFEDLKAQNRKGLIAYITAGDPTPEHTPRLVAALGARRRGPDRTGRAVFRSDCGRTRDSAGRGTRFAGRNDVAASARNCAEKSGINRKFLCCCLPI